jgi:hypothetical protein
MAKSKPNPFDKGGKGGGKDDCGGKSKGGKKGK